MKFVQIMVLPLFCVSVCLFVVFFMKKVVLKLFSATGPIYNIFLLIYPYRHSTKKQSCIKVDAMSQHRIDIDATLFRHHVPAGIDNFYSPERVQCFCIR